MFSIIFSFMKECSCILQNSISIATYFLDFFWGWSDHVLSELERPKPRVRFLYGLWSSEFQNMWSPHSGWYVCTFSDLLGLISLVWFSTLWKQWKKSEPVILIVSSFLLPFGCLFDGFILANIGYKFAFENKLKVIIILNFEL